MDDNSKCITSMTIGRSSKGMTLHFYDDGRVVQMFKGNPIAEFTCANCNKPKEYRDAMICINTCPNIVRVNDKKVSTNTIQPNSNQEQPSSYAKLADGQNDIPDSTEPAFATRDKKTNSNDNTPSCCNGCIFYPCELAFQYEVFSAAHESDKLLKDYRSYTEKKSALCLLRPGSKKNSQNGLELNIKGKECGTERVSEGIGSQYQVKLNSDSKQSIQEYDPVNEIRGLDRWTANEPVFIWAPPSRGKNYFIENEIIPYVKRLNRANATGYRILILSNRLALKKQIQAHLNGNEEEKCIYHLNQFVDVTTYQSILKVAGGLQRKQQERLNRYLYVICDEAHFFTSDAGFNPDTHRILQAIISIFKNAVRVYMSATPNECIGCISYEELASSRPQAYLAEDMRMLEYHFRGNYDYLDLKSYQNFDDAFIEYIADSVALRSEKWLIFVDDKNEIERIARELHGHIGKRGCKAPEVVGTLSAAKKSSKLFQKIVENEELPGNTQVLITTSALDNGVNIRGIDNIVVSDMNEVECLQQVGRARLIEGEHKTLYLKRFTKQDVEQQRNDINRRWDAYSEYDAAFPKDIFDPQKISKFFDRRYQGNQADWELSKHLFRREYCYSSPRTPEFKYNDIARSLAEVKAEELDRIYAEMQAEEDEGREIGESFLRYQASWFGKDELPPMDWVSVVEQAALEREGKINDFFEDLRANGTQIDKEIKGNKNDNVISWDDFTKQLIELWKVAFGEKLNKNQGNRSLGMKTINDALESHDILYRVEAERPQAGPWWIARFQPDSPTNDVQAVIEY